MAQDFEFRSFMLQVSKDMSSTDFGQLKYLLKGFVSSAKCEETTEVCAYFEELERMCLLKPTNFGVLKKALGAIGRQDLVEKIEQKEQYFANLFRESNDDNLGPKEYDAVCDGITKAAGRLEALARSGQNTPELKKKLILTSADNENEIQMQELYNLLSASDTPTDVIELEKENKIKKKADDTPLQKEEPPKQSHHVIGIQTGEEAEPIPSPQMDKAENMKLPSENAAELNSSEDAMAVEDQPTEHEVASEEKTTVSKTDQKEPSEDTVPDCNELEGLNAGKTPVTHNTAEACTGAAGLTATAQPSISSRMELDDDVVTDGNEDDKNGVESKKDDVDKTTSKGAEYQGPQHVHGPGARPKELPLLKKAKIAGPSEATEQNATEQADEGTTPHGTLFAEINPGDCDANSKEPTEGAYSGPSSPTGNISLNPDESNFELNSDASTTGNISIIPDDESDSELYYDEEESTGSLQEKPKSTSYGPGKGAGASKECYHPPGFFSTPSSDHGVSAYNDDPAAGGLPLSDLIQIASAMGLNFGPTASQQPYDQMALMNQLLALQQSMSGGFTPSTNQAPNSYSYSSASSSGCTADSPLQSNCYKQAGYAVAISNGYLCESTNEKGVVMMESGTQFCIAIANDNGYAAEVDITFGGMYLGVWTVEAKQSLSSPLVIEGSSWAQGRLRFFSASDGRKHQPSADIYGTETPALNGIIELEFKPEVKVLTLFAQHARAPGTDKKDLHTIKLPDFETATVGDLKQVISKKWRPGISYLINGGEVLQEEKTISSYALNENEVIQILNAKEELKIESFGNEPVTMMVDPCTVSVEEVKDFIASKIKIQVDEQLLRFKGQDEDVDSKSLTRMLIKSKEIPVLKVAKDTPINIKVLLPDGNEEKVEINWFATVDDLKEKLEERNIRDTVSLKFSGKDQEISGQGSKKLIDLGFKNKSEIQVVTVSQPKRGTHRGFGGINFDSPRTSQTRGFGGGMRGFDDHISAATYRGSSSGTRTFRGDPEDVEHDCVGGHGEEGIAMLYGTEENVSKHFQVDTSTQFFSKEKAVTLIIQLKAKSMGAEAPSQPSTPSEAHCSGGATGPRSTPCPPPVPE